MRLELLAALMSGDNLPAGGMRVGLPPRPFLYTLDQISVILDISLDGLRKGGTIYYEGRSIGIHHKYMMLARNIANPNETPDWRVAEYELKRWLRHRGFKYYDRGVVKN